MRSAGLGALVHCHSLPSCTRGAPCSSQVLPAPSWMLPAPSWVLPTQPRVLPTPPEMLPALSWELATEPKVLPAPARCSPALPQVPCFVQGVTCSVVGAPHSVLGAPPSTPCAPPPPSSALGLSLRVHGVGWPPQGGMGPVLMPSLGAGQWHRPELPHVSEEGQHRLRPEAALHWVGGHPGGHHGCFCLVSAQAQRCERGLPG